MNHDSRLSSLLHVLLHMAHSNRPLTSDALAACLQTNPVVVRRTLATLRKLGHVRSGKGHGGGWSIACDLQQITLRDVYAALGDPPLLALGHRSTNPTCLVEQAVNSALGDAFEQARKLLVERLGAVTLADLSADFNRRYAAHPHSVSSPLHAQE